ncbi:MAG: PorP/SprF family type IX secretion system membrane protein [Chitinophagales bacterium]|nr:PorP/SprF family type IX secretion system membrane protein [Chitinophagales bacterium]MDW8394042.1 PorP/SprF family type IX secretion system membrane protein [Chitinophagales bacterium]
MKKNLFPPLLAALLLRLPLPDAVAQDALLSQPFQTPLQINPAWAGFHDGTYQLNGMYRSQWQTLTDPFKTIAAHLNTSLPAGKNKNHIVGLALSGNADKAGAVQFTTSAFALTGAFHYNFGHAFQHYMGAAVSFGAGNTALDLASVTTDETFTTGGTSEAIGFEKTNFSDLSFGLAYHLLSDTSHLHVGFALFHANSPDLAFTSDGRSSIRPKAVLAASYSYLLRPQLEFTPVAIVTFQGPSRQLLAGGQLRYSFASLLEANYALAGALYLRYGNALIPAIGIRMGDLDVGLSYDLMMGPLAGQDSRQGAMELTLSYKGKLKGISSGRIYNPRFGN